MLKLNLNLSHPLYSCLLIIIFLGCSRKQTVPNEAIQDIELKRGDVVMCGPANKQFGAVSFDLSCSEKIKKDFELAMALLHSFEYDEAEKVFAKVIDKEPGCAMAYWGVAMSNYHPLWVPPTQPELEKGSKAIAIARSISQKSAKESAYIEALALFYKDWDQKDHRTRSTSYEKAMELIYTDYPEDFEAAIFYALSLIASADPTDKTFSKQKKAGDILNARYPNQPEHPGIIHYTIHTYDSPELASLALPAARKYATIAPSSAHAQHMPSHIFIRLGLWDESISSNLVSVDAAKCYAESTGLKGHWDEELHGLDYLEYAYLQNGDNQNAKELLDYLNTITVVEPATFKVAYAFAAMPARYALENKMWTEAANLKIHPVDFPWQKFPWERSIMYFARALGSVHVGKIDSAKSELKNLQMAHEALLQIKDSYKANQVDIQMKASEAWILLKEGKKDEALKLMTTAADMEDSTQKHPVTPGEVIPARELLGDMLMELGKYKEALEAYEADLKNHQNRFNGLYGAGLAAEKSGNSEKAELYYRQLLAFVHHENSNRPELKKLNQYIN